MTNIPLSLLHFLFHILDGTAETTCYRVKISNPLALSLSLMVITEALRGALNYMAWPVLTGRGYFSIG